MKYKNCIPIHFYGKETRNYITYSRRVCQVLLGPLCVADHRPFQHDKGNGKLKPQDMQGKAEYFSVSVQSY